MANGEAAEEGDGDVAFNSAKICASLFPQRLDDKLHRLESRTTIIAEKSLS